MLGKTNIEGANRPEGFAICVCKTKPEAIVDGTIN